MAAVLTGLVLLFAWMLLVIYRGEQAERTDCELRGRRWLDPRRHDQRCLDPSQPFGPVSVTLGDGWRTYVTHVPDGWVMLGTVHRKRDHVGALVRSPRGELFCMRGASVERLVQERVEAALASAVAQANTSGANSP